MDPFTKLQKQFPNASTMDGRFASLNIATAFGLEPTTPEKLRGLMSCLISDFFNRGSPEVAPGIPNYDFAPHNVWPWFARCSAGQQRRFYVPQDETTDLGLLTSAVFGGAARIERADWLCNAAYAFAVDAGKPLMFVARGV